MEDAVKNMIKDIFPPQKEESNTCDLFIFTRRSIIMTEEKGDI